MTPFRSALNQLAALVVSGVAHNYGVDTLPETLHRAQLPALLVLPGDVTGTALFPARGGGFEAIAFSAGAREVTYTVTHLLLVAPVQAGRGARSHLPRVAELIDAYFTTLGSDLTLGGTLLEPTRVEVEPGTFTRGGVTYHGCAFRHWWRVQV